MKVLVLIPSPLRGIYPAGEILPLVLEGCPLLIVALVWGCGFPAPESRNRAQGRHSWTLSHCTAPS